MHKLNISPKAREDLGEISNYIAHELKNKTAALSTISKIIRKIETLAEFPLSGEVLDGIIGVTTGYRFVVCGNYLIFYRIAQSEVFISRVLYAKRDYMQILFTDQI